MRQLRKTFGQHSKKIVPTWLKFSKDLNKIWCKCVKNGQHKLPKWPRTNTSRPIINKLTVIEKYPHTQFNLFSNFSVPLGDHIYNGCRMVNLYLNFHNHGDVRGPFFIDMAPRRPRYIMTRSLEGIEILRPIFPVVSWQSTRSNKLHEFFSSVIKFPGIEIQSSIWRQFSTLV